MHSAAPIVADSASMAEAEQAIARLEGLAARHDATFGGTTVCWRSIGQGSPLALIHGGHGSWLHWVRNAEALARRHTVWIPDMPSYGDSGPLAEPADLAHLVAATRHTLDQLVGADTVVGLVGFSFGGLVSAHIAAQRGNVARLALIGAAGHGTARRQTLDMVNWRRSPDADAMLADLRTNLRALMISDDARIDALALAVHRAACLNTRFRSRPLSMGNSLPQALEQYAGPILFAWGEHDVTGQPEAAGRLMTDGRPERSFEIIPDAGHWAQFEQADAVNRMLLRFFD